MPMLQDAAQAQPAPTAAPAAPETAPAAPGAPAGPSNAPPGVEGDTAAVQPEGEVAAGEEASPEEQAEYDRVMNAAQKVVYENDATSDAIIGMVQPDDKIGTTVAATLLLLKQLDDKLDMDEVVIPQVTQDLADMVIDLAEAAHGIQYSERDLQNVLGATWEGVMDIYGVDADDYDEFMGTMSDEEQKQQGEVYKQFVGE